MRIAQWMDIAHGARDGGRRDLHNLAVSGQVQVARGAHLNLRIAALRLKRREPPDFKLETDYRQQVSFLKFQQEAWLGIDKVRILIALGDGVDVNAIAPDLLRDRR